jgi:Actinobacteria/chloroflexi VLRF1 release factor
VSGPRRVEVPPERLTRWVEGFARRHGDLSWHRDATAYVVVAGDGSRARLSTWRAASQVPPADLASWADPPARLGLVLVRRGGYAVGRAEGERLVTHHCGTRYVQSRTAAGGWSQQRFARRRGNQADALVTSVADRAVTMLAGERLDALVVGGDRALVTQVLATARLQRLGSLPRRELPDLGDPRLAVLQTALSRGRAVQVSLTDPA